MKMRRWLGITLGLVMLLMLVSCGGNQAAPTEQETVEPTASQEEQEATMEQPQSQAAMLEVYARYTENYPFEKFPLYAMQDMETFGYTITDMGGLGYGELYTFTYYVDQSVQDVDEYYKELAGAEAVGQRYSVDGYSLQVSANDYTGKTHVTVILGPPASDTVIVNEHMAYAFSSQEPLIVEHLADALVLSNGVMITPDAYFFHRGYDANAEGLGGKLKVAYEEALKGSKGYEVTGDDSNWKIKGEYNGFAMEAEFSYGIFALTTWYDY